MIDELCVAIKRIETSKAFENNSQHVNSITSSTPLSSEIRELRGMIHQLTNRFDKLEVDKITPTPTPIHKDQLDSLVQENWTSQTQTQPPFVHPSQNFPENFTPAIPPLIQPGASGYSNQFNGSSAFPGQSYSVNQPSQSQPVQHGGDYYGTSQQGNVVCYRCGQIGHVKIGCRVRLDHYRGNSSNRGRHLNRYRPMRRGHP